MRAGLAEFLARTHKGDTARWTEIVEIAFEFLANQYAKVVQHNREYLYSAFLSDRLFETQELEDFRGKSKEQMKVDSILYPSVKNGLEKFNLAVYPTVFDEKFKLHKVEELEIVGEEQYKLLAESTTFDFGAGTISW